MGTCNVPIEAAIRDLVQDTDLEEDQLVRAIADAVRECHEREMISELKKLNTYFALITGQIL